MDQARNLANLCVVEEDLKHIISKAREKRDDLQREVDSTHDYLECLNKKLEETLKKKERLAKAYKKQREFQDSSKSPLKTQDLAKLDTEEEVDDADLSSMSLDVFESQSDVYSSPHRESVDYGQQGLCVTFADD